MFISFDCLHARGRDLTAAPLRERRAILERELAPAGRHVAIVRRLDPNGLDAWAQVVSNGWEGLVAKDEASPYVPGAHTRR